jgi:hypothetical protein
MAVIRHMIHPKSASSGVTPDLSEISYGEIAVNYNENTPFLAIKVCDIHGNNPHIIKFLPEGYDKKYLSVSGGTVIDDVTINGTLTVNGDIDYSGSMNQISAPTHDEPSDIRIKENIEEITQEDIEKVGNVKLVSYNYISDENKRKRYGVIAQDLKDGLDNLVIEGGDGMLSVDITAFLCLKIKSLEEEIKKLKEKQD